MRLLYVSRSSVGHDRRFTAAWESLGFEVAAIVIGRSFEPEGAGHRASRAELTVRIADFAPDIVQVGPVTDPAWDVVQAWDGPLIATSWGFDLMAEVDSNADLRERARAVLARADLLFVDNDGPRKRAESLGMDPLRIAQFPWGLDPTWFRQRERTPLSDRNDVLFLCTRRHEDIYRVGDVVEAFLGAASDHGNIRLSLAGSGNQTSQLKARVDASGLQGRIVFVGEMDNSALPVAYRAADAYITSSSVDGTSVSLLEAMASGTPVLASRIEGNAEWVSANTGFGFEAGAVTQLETLIREFASMAPEFVQDVRRRANNALELVRQQADWNTSVQKFPDYVRAAVRHWTNEGSAAAGSAGK